MDYEQAKKHREFIEAEAQRLYDEDRAIRRICDSVVAEALEKIHQSDGNETANAVAEAVMRAVAMVAGKSSDANYIMAERDMYRDQLLRASALQPGIPIHPTQLADKGIPGLAEIQGEV